MIVECDQCSTRFQLDESRIPARGIRVRCSRCKHAFFLKRPDASQAEAIEDVATEAAQNAAVPPPHSTQDLSPQSAVGAPSENSAESGEEDDWEFNHDDSSEGNEQAAFDAADDDDDFPLAHDSIALENSGDAETSIDLAGEVDEPPSEMEEQEPESGFGGIDEMDALSAAGADPAAEASLSDEARAAVDQLLDSTPPGQSDSELGDPENWDFFSDDAGPDPGAAAQVALPAPVREVAAPAALQDAAGDGLDAYVAESSASPRVRMWLAAAGRAAGWTLTVGLLLVGGVRGLFPEFQPIGNRIAEVRVGDLRVSNLEPAWIDTARSGPVLSISGVLHNPSPDRTVPVEGLGIELLDDQGARLDVASGRAGHPLDSDALRQLPPDALAEAHARSVAHLTGTTISPGGSARFSVLFSEVPGSARRFLIQGTGEVPAAPSDAGAEAVEENAPGQAADLESMDAGLAAPAAQALELAPTAQALELALPSDASSE